MFVEHKEQGEQFRENDSPTITKLSQAMRIGAKLHPQAFGGLTFENGRTCAIGAAYVGVFGEPNLRHYGIFLTMDAVKALTTVGLWPSGLEAETVYRLNDGQHWSRERIADWLESQGY